MAKRKDCDIYQAADTMYCRSCGIAWDANDSDPPKCPRGQRFRKFTDTTWRFVVMFFAALTFTFFFPSDGGAASLITLYVGFALSKRLDEIERRVK